MFSAKVEPFTARAPTQASKVTDEEAFTTGATANAGANPDLAGNQAFYFADMGTPDEDPLAYEKQFAGPSDANKLAEEQYLIKLEYNLRFALLSGQSSKISDIKGVSFELSEKAKEKLFQLACILGDKEYITQHLNPLYEIDLSTAKEPIIEAITRGYLKNRMLVTQQNIVKALTAPLFISLIKTQLLEWMRNESIVLDDRYMNQLLNHSLKRTYIHEGNSVLEPVLDIKFRELNNTKEKYLAYLKQYFSVKSRAKMAVVFLTELFNSKNNFLKQARENKFLFIDFTERNGLTNSFFEAVLFLLKKIPEAEFTSDEMMTIIERISGFTSTLRITQSISGYLLAAVEHVFFKTKMNVITGKNTTIVDHITSKIESIVLSKTSANRETRIIRAQLEEGGLPLARSIVTGKYDNGNDEAIQKARTEISEAIETAIDNFLGYGATDTLSSKTGFDLINSSHLKIMLKLAEISPSEFGKLIAYLTQLKESDLMALERTPFFQQFGINPTRAVQAIDKIIDALKYGYYSFGRGYLVNTNTAPVAAAAPSAAPQ